MSSHEVHSYQVLMQKITNYVALYEWNDPFLAALILKKVLRSAKKVSSQRISESFFQLLMSLSSCKKAHTRFIIAQEEQLSALENYISR
jgi:hypothetical protein